MIHKIRQCVQFNLLFLACYLRVVRGRGIESVNRKVDTWTGEVFATIYKPLECRDDYNNRKCSDTVVWQMISWSFSDLIMANLLMELPVTALEWIHDATTSPEQLA